MKPKLLSCSILVVAMSLLSLMASSSVSVAGANVIGTTAITRAILPTHPRWTVDTSPNFGANSNVLENVSAVSPNDVWAAGISNVTNSGGSTLIEHWNGGAWHIVDSPNVGSGSNFLGSIAALAHNDAWAVGAYYSGSNQFTLTEHWNGSAWTVVPSPNPSGNMGGNSLMGMAATSSRDIWAVGAYNPGGGALDGTMILHWDGTTWQIVSSPNYSGFNTLFSVSASSSTDAWAVGANAQDWSFDNPRPLAMHWDGTSWNLVSVPMPTDATDAYLLGVAMGGRNNVWAVGTYRTSDGNYHSLALKWDGEQWTISPGYSIPGASYNELRGVAVSHDTTSNVGNVWAVGWGATVSPPNPFSGPPEAPLGAQTMILHWSNGAWNRVDSPSPGVGSQLMGLAAFANRAWTVGNYINDSSSPTRTLIESYSPHFPSMTADLRFSR